MSNNMTVPAHIAQRIAERNKTNKGTLAKAIVSDSGPSIPRISIRAGRFRLVESGVETTVGTNLDVIIVGVNPRVSKVFYGRPFDASAENQRPDCFSNDGLRPDVAVESPVNDSCANCPNNVLGSKILPSGSKSKMCADQRHLAVVPAADPQKVYSLTVPVSAMRALREYFTELANYNIGPEEAITELGFDEQASYPRLIFKQKGYVPEKALPLIDTLLESDDTKVATRLMAPVAKAPTLSAPEVKPKIEAPKASAADDEAGAYEEPVQASTKAEPPKVEPVKQSDELEAQLDSLFD
jgi:hypothetical protein|tara:strand:+ start:1885 stop:2775 length:891 start_codon:yes stop_codon:yes gene_type:complete